MACDSNWAPEPEPPWTKIMGLRNGNCLALAGVDKKQSPINMRTNIVIIEQYANFFIVLLLLLKNSELAFLISPFH
jgi:hypothetical protein